MVSENNIKDNGAKGANLVPSIPEIKPSVKPATLTDRQASELKAQADKAVQSLVKAEGSQAMALSDSIANVGICDQKAVSSGIQLLQEKMGSVFYGAKKSQVTADLTKNVSELQTALVRINPKDIQKETRYRIVRYVPFLGNWLVRVLKESNTRSLTLQQFIEHLEDSLKNGETILKQDNAQLLVMCRDIEDKQKLVAADAYYAEVLMEKLDEAIIQTQDEKKKGQLQKVLFRVSTRAQDLRAMENINEQFSVAIEMTRDNNDMLVGTVQRMLSMGMNVVYVSMAIHAALLRQSNVLAAAQGTRDFIGNMIVSNATQINNHIKEIGDLYKEPIVAMDKIGKACELLEQAIDETNKLKIESIERAKGNIAKIKVLTEEIKTKAGTLPDTDVKSLEASKTLELPVGRG